MDARATLSQRSYSRISRQPVRPVAWVVAIRTARRSATGCSNRVVSVWPSEVGPANVCIPLNWPSVVQTQISWTVSRRLVLGRHSSTAASVPGWARSISIQVGGTLRQEAGRLDLAVDHLGRAGARRLRGGSPARREVAGPDEQGDALLAIVGELLVARLLPTTVPAAPGRSVRFSVAEHVPASPHQDHPRLVDGLADDAGRAHAGADRDLRSRCRAVSAGRPADPGSGPSPSADRRSGRSRWPSR